MRKTIEDDIEHIVESSKDNLYYLCTRTGHMPNDQLFPAVIAYSQTSQIIDYEDVEAKAARVFDVSINFLEKKYKPAFVPDGKGGETRESQTEYETRVKIRRKQMIGILEQIIEYLTDDEFPFRYEVLTDIDFNPVDVDEQKYSLFGVQATFSVATGYNKNICCIDFDEAKIKAYNKNK